MIFSILLISFALSGCSQSPQPISYGSDECAHCKMTIMDPKFAGEIITQKGKVYKFDDVQCLVKFQDSENLKGEKIAGRYITDYSGLHQLIKVEECYFLLSEDFKSPMRGDMAAFFSVDSMKLMEKKLNGIPITWNEILKQK